MFTEEQTKDLFLMNALKNKMNQYYDSKTIKSNK